MQCLDCGAENDHPDGKTILLDDVFDGHIDVDASVQEHIQLECRECGAVLGYAGTAAAIGSSNVRGFY